MGFFWDLFRGEPSPVIDFAQSPAETFMVDADSIDPAVFGLTSYTSPVAPAPRIDRKSAMQVPAVKRSRDLIAGTLGGLPLDLVGMDGQPVVSNLFTQPEKNVPRSVTMARTFEDLLFEQVAWWRVTEFGWHTYPVWAQRLDPRTVTVSDGKVYVEGKHVPDSEIIRFDSPTDGLLIAGARAIRTCLHLDAAAARFSEGVPPLDYFTPADGVDPAEDADVIDILNQWQTARQTRGTAYVPAALKYNTGGFSPEQLQMADARQHAVLEIARIAGLDPEALGVSTTSRTYFNAADRRKEFVDFTLGQYRQAVEDRLSMADVTPRGYTARFNLSEFMRSDDQTRMSVATSGLSADVLTDQEARRYFNPSLPVAVETPARVAASAEQPLEFSKVTPHV
jgi:hypothetical protein